MILTGKSKEDFETFIFVPKRQEIEYILRIPLGRSIVEYFYTLPETIQHAYIIEWFDSVGMFLDVQCGRKDLFDWEVCQHINGYKPLAAGWKSTRSEATKAGIQEADLIYNEKHKQR